MDSFACSAHLCLFAKRSRSASSQHERPLPPVLPHLPSRRGSLWLLERAMVARSCAARASPERACCTTTATVPPTAKEALPARPSLTYATLSHRVSYSSFPSLYSHRQQSRLYPPQLAHLCYPSEGPTRSRSCGSMATGSTRSRVYRWFVDLGIRPLDSSIEKR